MRPLVREFLSKRNASGPAFLLKNTRNFRVAASGAVPDTTLEMAAEKSLP
jgi:hypothetical protein